MNRALIAAAVTGVQVGAAIVASRYVVRDLPPLTLALVRYAIGLLCLAPFVPAALARFDGPRPRFADLFFMAALGIGQFGVLIALLNYSLQRIPAAQVALIFSLFPLLTLVLGGALGRERIAVRVVAGSTVCLLGVALPLIQKLQGGLVHDWLGEGAAFGSALIGAICSVYYRPWLRRFPTVPVSAYAMLASVVFLAMLAWPEQWPSQLARLSLSGWAIVGFIGFSSGVGYFLWLYALKHEPASKVTIFLGLNPVTAAVLGWAFLGEPVSGIMVAAIGLIGVGLWMATRE